MIRKSKINLLFVLFLSLFLLFIPPVSADGFFYTFDTELYYWELQTEDQQLCVINYENGIQKMIIAVDVNNLQGERGVWIFPIPSVPDETTIDIIKGFPRLEGITVLEKTERRMRDSFRIMISSQVYPLPFLLLMYVMGGSMEPGSPEGITIHEHIEKMGLSTELISAENESAFYGYLVDKGLELPSQSRTVLNEYMGEEYTFAVSWISDIEQFKNESGLTDRSSQLIDTVGVSVNFPTDKLYFPLRPTSIYGDTEIPIFIYVLGHVKPELYAAILGDTRITYYDQYYYEVPDQLSSFFDGRENIRDGKYTKIKVKTASHHLTEDLWINNSLPKEIKYVNYVKDNSRELGALFFIIISCLASLFAGMIVYYKDHPSKISFFSFGLLNIFSIIGFAYASNLFKINERFTKEKKTEQKSADYKKIGKQSLIISAVITFLLMSLPTIGALLSGFDVILFALFIILLSFILTFIFIFPLINLYYNNQKLLIFVILFSVLILILTFLFQVTLYIVLKMLIISVNVTIQELISFESIEMSEILIIAIIFLKIIIEMILS